VLSTVLADPVQPAQAGPLGLFIILLLAAATILLIRSMNRHLRRVPPRFDAPDRGGPADSAAADPSADDRPAP
jgi:hypothetical protein